LGNVGSKEKFWYTRKDGYRWLFKTNRPNTGEDWAEKIAAELCALLGLPHATYELAEWTPKRGVISRRMGQPGEQLVTWAIFVSRMSDSTLIPSIRSA